MFLLDTNIVSELTKRRPDSRVIARLDSQLPSSLFISSVTVFELHFGAAKSAKPATLWRRIEQDIIRRFQVIPFSGEEALLAADILAPLKASGRNVALPDLWLAGTALSRNFILVTRNVRHFEGLAGLQLENWFE